MEAAPTCFGLQRNHHQGATASVCCALCKRIRLHSAQHTRHTMPP